MKTILLSVFVPLGALVYLLLTTFIAVRWRAQHRDSCKECQAQIEREMRNRRRWADWHHSIMLCDKADIGTALVAIFWPVAFVFPLFVYVKQRAEATSTQRRLDMEARIEELEKELSIR